MSIDSTVQEIMSSARSRAKTDGENAMDRLLTTLRPVILDAVQRENETYGRVGQEIVVDFTCLFAALTVDIVDAFSRKPPPAMFDLLAGHFKDIMQVYRQEFPKNDKSY